MGCLLPCSFPSAFLTLCPIYLYLCQSHAPPPRRFAAPMHGAVSSEIKVNSTMMMITDQEEAHM
jgi:hypothetical protein